MFIPEQLARSAEAQLEAKSSSPGGWVSVAQVSPQRLHCGRHELLERGARASAWVGLGGRVRTWCSLGVQRVVGAVGRLRP